MEFRLRPLPNLALIHRLAPITAGHAVNGVNVHQAEQKQESAVKYLIVKAELHRLLLLNPAPIFQHALLILGNVVIGDPARRKAFKPEVVAELTTARPRKQQRQQLRNIAKRQTNPNYNRQLKI